MLVGYKLTSRASLAQSKPAKMLRYTKRTNTSEMKAFCCAVLILCLTTGHAMPQIAGSLCDSTSLHDTLCAPLLIGKKQ